MQSLVITCLQTLLLFNFPIVNSHLISMIHSTKLGNDIEVSSKFCLSGNGGPK